MQCTMLWAYFLSHYFIINIISITYQYAIALDSYLVVQVSLIIIAGVSMMIYLLTCIFPLSIDDNTAHEVVN